MTSTRVAHGVDSSRPAGVVIVTIALAVGIGLFAPRSAHADRRVIERIEIHGNSWTRDKVIRPVLGVHEGGALEDGDLDRVRRSVGSLGYFTRVAVRVQPGSSTELVRIDIDVTERARAAKGTGFTSTDSFIAVCTMQQQRPKR